MELKTILAIIYANGYENIITRAVAIGNNLDPLKDTKVLRVDVSKEKLAKGKQFNMNKSSGYLDCPVVAYNEFKLDNPFLVLLPNGDTKWTTNYHTNNNYSLTEVIDIPVAEDAPLNH